MIKLSIIITAYNAEPYIHELLDVLEPQVTDEIQTIVIDDGSDKPLEIDRPWLEFYSNDGNKGIPYSRNRGIELAKGECIHIIDADDLVPSNYVIYILNLVKSKDFDYIDLSWKSLPGGGAQCNFKLNSDEDSLPNPSASTRIFSRKFIGDTRFNLNKDAAEDEDFTRHLGIKHAKRICATEYMYFYRTYVPNSNSKLYFSGLRKTHKVGFFYKNVSKDRTDILELIKKADEQHEPVLLTYQNDIPEIEKYATVICPPKTTKVMEIYGEPTNLLQQIPMPIKAELVLYSSTINSIGGVETFICNFVKHMRDRYDIVVLYDHIDDSQFTKITKYARCVKHNPSMTTVCDNLIMVRIKDKIPSNVKYKKIFQMVHCVKQQDFIVPQSRDAIICVSNASKKSFGAETKNAAVINNLSDPEDKEKALILVSATRIHASDKGINDDRMIRLAKLLKEQGIKFVWMYFGNTKLLNEPEGMMYMGVKADMKPYIKAADYLVQLSDQEAFSYSLLEALTVGTPVIATPLEQNRDMKIKDGLNGYVVPFDFDETFDCKKFLKIPKFNYKYDNEKLINKWDKLIRDTKPRSMNMKKPVMIKCVRRYMDMELNRTIAIGEMYTVELERADHLVSLGLVERV